MKGLYTGAIEDWLSREGHSPDFIAGFVRGASMVFGLFNAARALKGRRYQHRAQCEHMCSGMRCQMPLGHANGHWYSERVVLAAFDKLVADARDRRDGRA